jgi:hypothetical protein
MTGAYEKSHDSLRDSFPMLVARQAEASRPVQLATDRPRTIDCLAAAEGAGDHAGLARGGAARAATTHLGFRAAGCDAVGRRRPAGRLTVQPGVRGSTAAGRRRGRPAGRDRFEGAPRQKPGWI